MNCSRVLLVVKDLGCRFSGGSLTEENFIVTLFTRRVNAMVILNVAAKQSNLINQKKPYSVLNIPFGFSGTAKEARTFMMGLGKSWANSESSSPIRMD